MIAAVGAGADGARGRGGGGAGLRGDAGIGEHASPSVPDADAGGSGGQDALLFGWLKTLYPIWARFRAEEMFVSAEVGLAELRCLGVR